MPLRPRTLATAILLAAAALPSCGFAQRIDGEPLRIENTKRGPAEAFKSGRTSASATLRFLPMSEERLDALKRHNASAGKRAQIGIGRSVADEAVEALPRTFDWRPVTGGHVLRIDVESPGAAALRVGIDPRNLPEGVELRVASPTLARVLAADHAALHAGMDDRGLFWSPVTDGALQQLELFVPTGTPLAALRPGIQAVSHLVRSPLRPFSLAKGIGDSGSCNIDVVCRVPTLGQAFVNAKNAVAHMVYTSGGESFVCTGTLLNDAVPATQVPYFFSAAHCLSLQSEANTLETFWNYETPTCNVDNAGTNTELTGGADLLYADLPSDVLLLRLRGAPPAGAFFAGWDAGPVTLGQSQIAIHHPQGDIKKYSRGSSPGNEQTDTGGGIGNFTRMNWAEGTTEGGSSGSGIFTLRGGQYYLRGGLYGGTASCLNSNGPDIVDGNQDYYSRLDLAYPSLAQWLGTFAGPTRDYTGAWYVPAESGWGLTVFNYPGQLFSLFFVYDTQGRATWYRFQGVWSGTDTMTANLDRATGPVWASSFNPASVSYTTVGTATITFTSATAATLTFNDGIVNRTVTLAKI